MINRKLNQIILALLIIGALVTFWTGEAVRNLREQRVPAETAREENTVPETKVEPAAGPSINVRKRSSGRYEEFRRKFRETEETIARMRAAENKNQSDVERQNSASSQLRYWETQMNSVYQTIMSVLSTEEAAVLSRDQQDWKKQREKDAAEAARNSAGSRQESTEYTLSQAEATRQRAYELLERYRDRL